MSIPILKATVSTVEACDTESYLGEVYSSLEFSDGRLAIQGMPESRYLVAFKRALGTYDMESSFAQCNIGTVETPEYVYVEKDSLKKRLCNTATGIETIVKLFSRAESEEFLRELAGKLHLVVGTTGSVEDLQREVTADLKSRIDQWQSKAPEQAQADLLKLTGEQFKEFVDSILPELTKKGWKISEKEIDVWQLSNPYFLKETLTKEVALREFNRAYDALASQTVVTAADFIALQGLRINVSEAHKCNTFLSSRPGSRKMLERMAVLKEVDAKISNIQRKLKPETAKTIDVVKKGANKFKKCSVARDLLKKGTEQLTALSHEKAETFIKRLNPLIASDSRVDRSRTTVVDNDSSICKRRERANKINGAVDEVFRERWEYQGKLYPLCVGISTSGLPKIELVHLSKLKFDRTVDRLPNGNLYVKTEVLEQLKNLPPLSYPKTKEELDAFVQILAKETRNIVPWGYTTDGCYARGQHVLDLLQLMGMPLNKMEKQYNHVPKEHRKQNWWYHIAAIVKLQDGTRWVIDPAIFEPNEQPRALSAKEWVDRQKKDPNVPIDDRGFVELDIAIPLSSSECVAYRSSIITKMGERKSDSSPIMCELDSISRDANLTKLGEYRGKLEESHLKKAVVPPLPSPKVSPPPPPLPPTPPPPPKRWPPSPPLPTASLLSSKQWPPLPTRQFASLSSPLSLRPQPATTLNFVL